VREPRSLSLVASAYNEVESLPHLLAAIDGVLPTLTARGLDVDMIVVDDGSTDSTPTLLREATAARPWLRVLRLVRNFGQTAAMQAGFEAARGQVVIALDADMQNDPADLPALLDKLDEGYDVVSGWRRHRQDRALSRRLPSWAANWLISRVTGVRLHDYGCTLKAYRREVLEGIRLYGEMHRFIPIHAAQRGARLTEMVVDHHPRRFGRTKYGLGRAPNVLLDLLLVQFLWKYGTKPMHVFGKFGLFNMFCSVVLFGAMIWFKFWGGKTFVETPLPLLVVMFFLIGGMSILLGVLAEITVRTYHEATKVSTYLVREIYAGGRVDQPARG
jgi:glycosyltransferase involved in cell wall biosynthesis